MKLNENDRFDEFLLGNKDMHKLEFALTKILKKKYAWINSIKLKVVVQDREFQNYYLYLAKVQRYMLGNVILLILIMMNIIYLLKIIIYKV